ncbi:MAG: hypothetical protein HYU64_16390, partial [Armatimonadetes bacterium]|nr:hypothetical protein [Armatimonadota bacterium]
KQEASPADTDHTDNGIGDQIRTVAENIIEGGDQDQVEHLLRLLSFAQARGIEISARTDELVERALNKKMEGDSGHGWFVSIAV